MSPGDEQLAVLVELRLVAGHELAGAPGPHPAGPVRDVDVVRLGRADPVEHLDAERLEPALVQLARAAPRRPRCRGAGRTGPASGPAMSGWVDHRRHHRRNLDEDRRAVLGDQLEDPLRRRALGEDDARAADAERVQRGQVARVAEEELRHRQDDVVLADSEHAPRVPVEAEHRAVHGMDGALRLPRAAGRELPDRDVVLRRRRRSSSSDASRRAARTELLARRRAPAARRRPAPARSLACVVVGDDDPRVACTRGSRRSPSAAGTCTPRR